MKFSPSGTRITLSLLALGALHFQASYCEDVPAQPQITGQVPWLTGPLLTPTGRATPEGHYNIEPYLFADSRTGWYNSHWQDHSAGNNFYDISALVFIQIGMPWDMDFFFKPAWAWNHTKGASHWTLNDMQFGFEYQLLKEKKEKWWPYIKLQLLANLPLGRYQKLDPRSKRTDIGGTGSWLPGVGLVFSRLYWWGGHYFFAPRFNITYTLPTPVHVKNGNTYGGGHHTHGTVYPGQSLLCLFGFEIALSQRWVVAADVQYQHFNKTRFKGHQGATHGIPNQVGWPSSESFSLAPAIEYSWSLYYGIIAGCWFSAAGRNAPEFANAVIAINIYH